VGAIAILAVAGSYYTYHLVEKGREKELQRLTLKAFCQGDILVPVVERMIPMPVL